MVNSETDEPNSFYASARMVVVGKKDRVMDPLIYYAME